MLLIGLIHSLSQLQLFLISHCIAESQPATTTNQVHANTTPSNLTDEMGNQVMSTKPDDPKNTQMVLNEFNNIEQYQKLHDKQHQCVAKVFPKYDLSIRLELYGKRVLEIKNIIYTRYGQCTNCLPYSNLILLDKAAYLFRQHIKYNLYDRLSTRPFLCDIEKKWIAFQLMCAVNEIHSLNIVHGDIKTENVLINSFLWVSLTDFASFKPVYLSQNHPSADFNYYFDTSRRRTCYLAPERFSPPSATIAASATDYGGVGGTNADSDVIQPPNPNDFKCPMDLFSLGCTIAELFMERPLFDFTHLLAYREGKKPFFCPKFHPIDDRSMLPYKSFHEPVATNLKHRFLIKSNKIRFEKNQTSN
jgi:phosphoinositide-3-kinase regulatory subunit 4